MNNNIKLFLPAAIFLVSLTACSKMKDIGILNQGNFTDTSSTLKDAAGITMGVAVDFTPMTTDQTYNATVKQNFDAVTFSYQMKHGAIVKDDGTLDYTNTDALVNACSGLEIYGHTLGWHQNQNATYLKSYSGLVVPASVELLQNPGFENSTTSLINWATYNASNGATISVGTGAANVYSGSQSMVVVNPVANPGAQYKVQEASDLFPTKTGTQYAVTYWVKAAAANGSIRLSTQPTASYQGDQTIGTSWQQVSWTFTAQDAQTRILFDMGQAANTYYIDNVSVKEVIPVASGEEVNNKLDTALNTFIATTVTRYKDKVKAWDVINELLADDGTLRNNTNTPTGSTDVFVWSNYLGLNYPLKAFQYAQAADPNALLFINDYNLESSAVKLDSLIATVTKLKGMGAKIDGIGTQMHISWNASKAGIDAMLQKLAATGLLIRISELDVKINPIPKLGFVLTPLEADYQAEMYQYVIQSYLKYIPAAQQYGITIWGLTDNTSWLYKNGTDFPLLFNADYSKKPAYSAVLDGLQGK